MFVLPGRNSEENLVTVLMPVPHLCLALLLAGSWVLFSIWALCTESSAVSWEQKSILRVQPLCDGTRDGSISSNFATCSTKVRKMFRRISSYFFHFLKISSQILISVSMESLSISILLSHSSRWNIQSSWAIQEAKRLSEMLPVTVLELFDFREPFILESELQAKVPSTSPAWAQSVQAFANQCRGAMELRSYATCVILVQANCAKPMVWNERMQGQEVRVCQWMC